MLKNVFSMQVRTLFVLNRASASWESPGSRQGHSSRVPTLEGPLIFWVTKGSWDGEVNRTELMCQVFCSQVPSNLIYVLRALICKWDRIPKRGRGGKNISFHFSFPPHNEIRPSSLPVHYQLCTLWGPPSFLTYTHPSSPPAKNT